MIGTCRKCAALITTAITCPDDAIGESALAVGLDMMQRVRHHYQTEHPVETWIEAEAVGGLAALFPYLAGCDIQVRQRAVMVLTFNTLKDRLFNMSFGAAGGSFGIPPSAGEALYFSSACASPMSACGKIEMLEELLTMGPQLWTIGGMRALLEREKQALRVSVAGESGLHLV